MTLAAGIVALVVPPAPIRPAEAPILRSDRMPGRIILPPDHPARIALPGDDGRIVTSLLAVPARLRYGQYVWNDRDVRPGERWVRIDLDRQILSVFRGGFEIGTAVILYGADGKPTPRGRFVIRERLRDHESSLYQAPMPYTLRLTDDGVAIHGSNVRERAATHGCIGVPLAFARHLFDEVRVGDPVTIG